MKDAKLQDECRCRHMRFQDCSQDKTRIREDTSLSITHLFGRILLNQVVFNVLKNPNPLKDVEAYALLDVVVLV